MLVGDYAQASLGLSGPWTYAVKAFTVAMALAANVFGVDFVSNFSALLLVFIMGPFVAIIVAGWSGMQPPSLLLFVPPPTDLTLGLFLATLVWQYQGWDTIGALAGEVKDVGRTYPRGVFLALVMNTLTFVVPVAFGWLISPHLHLWQAGYFSAIAESLGAWIGTWMLLAAGIANLAQCTAQLSSSSYSLAALGELGFGPRFLAYTSKRFEVPIVAIVINAVLTFGMAVVSCVSRGGRVVVP